VGNATFLVVPAGEGEKKTLGSEGAERIQRAAFARAVQKSPGHAVTPKNRVKGKGKKAPPGKDRY